MFYCKIKYFGGENTFYEMFFAVMVAFNILHLCLAIALYFNTSESYLLFAAYDQAPTCSHWMFYNQDLLLSS